MNTLGTAFRNGFKLGIHTEDVEAQKQRLHELIITFFFFPLYKPFSTKSVNGPGSKKKKKDLISFRKSIKTCMKYRKVIAQED